MYSSINQNVSQLVQFNQEELEQFNELLTYKKVPKKTFLLQAGEICNFEIYIIKGCIRTYYIDEKGNEVILTFATEDWWVSDICSFHERSPTQFFIESVEESELLLLSPTTKEQLLFEVPRFERVFRLMVQKHLAANQNRLLGNIAKSAQERYQTFLIKFPNLSQRVPQWMIASYLGMSPEFLSKLRKLKK